MEVLTANEISMMMKNDKLKLTTNDMLLSRMVNLLISIYPTTLYEFILKELIISKTLTTE